ncbi:class I SAM-dependent methyltransferase [Nocardia alba]|uniref:Methyltransferase family protein n=1 Tax=Nocardia alba TaxID=225051 RepID=A0A4R1FBS4_9NOCA|nr:class I SAM-dependent methyltransferase [Nocardia alba]TCJ90244.1 methyltransferase family protein [Nocardia alba]
MYLARSQKDVTAFYLAALASEAPTAERLSAPVSDRFAEFLNAIDVRAPRTALDLGYGRGTYAVALARAGFEVVAVDQVPTQILRSRLAGLADLADRINVVQQRIENFSVERQFGVVVAKDVLHYLRQDQVRETLTRCIQRAPIGTGHFLEVFTDIIRTDRQGRRVLIEDEAAYTADTFRTTIERLYTGWNCHMSLTRHRERNTDSAHNYFEANRITVHGHRTTDHEPRR